MSGIIDKSLIEAMQKNKSGDKEITRNEFRKNLKARVDATSLGCSSG